MRCRTCGGISQFGELPLLAHLSGQWWQQKELRREIPAVPSHDVNS
jgi:hypothetical protein